MKQRFARQLVSLSLGAFVLSACVGDPEEPRLRPAAGGQVAITAAALALEGVGDVVWDVEVESGLGDVVWQRRLSSSAYGDGAGSASFVGPCDASPDAAETTVRVWVVGVYGAAVPSGSVGAFNAGSAQGVGAVGATALDYASPTGAAALERTVTCSPNADVGVRFDVTLSRRAVQGFFDIAVSFGEVFCSAKLDCERAPGQDLELLHRPSGARGLTAVLGFACTASPASGGATWLYMDDPVIRCDGLDLDVVVDPSGQGHVDLAAPPSANHEGYLFAASVTRGAEAIGQAQYWNVAFGLDESLFADAEACTLTTRATAAREAWPQTPGGFALPPGQVYPVIHWTVLLSDATGRRCASHAVDVAGSGVLTTYEGFLPALNQFSWGSAPLFFDNRFDGEAVLRAASTSAPAPALGFGPGPFEVAPIDGASPGACTPLLLTNTGTAPGGGGFALTLTGPDAAAFALCQPEVGDPCDGPLAPGASCVLGVALAASHDGAFTATLAVTTVDALSASRPLIGAAANLAPALGLPPSPLEIFPILSTSPGPCTPLPVTNTGGTAASPPSVSFADPTHFQACSDGLPSPCAATLPPGATCDLGVRLVAASNGTYTTAATVASGALTAPLALRGTAYGLTPLLTLSAPAPVAALTSEADSGCVPLTVANTGTASAGGPFVLAFTGPDAARFEACTDGLSSPCGAALAPAATCALGARFAAVLPRTHTAVARLTAAGGLTAALALEATATGASLACAYAGPGWCTRYAYSFPAATTLAQAAAQCDADPDGLGLSTWTHCVGGPDDACPLDAAASRYASCADLDYSRWPTGYATFVCPAPILSLGAGTLDLGAFAGGTSPCYPVAVTNTGTEAGGGPYALAFDGGAASAFGACTDGLASPCAGPLAPGATCHLGVRVVTTQNGLLTTTLAVTSPALNTATRPVRASSSGLVAQLALDEDPLHVADLDGVSLSACVPLPVRNSGSATGGGSFAVSFSGAHAGRFGACTDGITDPCGAALAPGAVCNLGVRLSATEDGEYAATVTVTAAGGLQAVGTVQGTVANLSFVACPWFSPGWCEGYDASYPLPLGTTLAQAMTACRAAPGCLGVTTWPDCAGALGGTCDTRVAGRSGYTFCSDMVFDRWMTSYATYLCTGPGLALDGVHLDMDDASRWIGITEIRVIDDGGHDVTTGMTAVAAVSSGFGALGNLTSSSTYAGNDHAKLLDGAYGVGANWNASPGAEWDLWLRFPATASVRSVRVTFQAAYASPPSSLVFRDTLGQDLAPRIFSADPDTPVTGYTTWIYLFAAP